MSRTARGTSRRLRVTAGEARRRLDRVLADRLPEHSRSYLQRLIREGNVTIEGDPGQVLRVGRLVAQGEWLVVRFPPPRPSGLTPEPLPLDILHEDDKIVVVNKPAGIVVHPGAGRREGTLVHALLHHCRDLSGIGGVERPGIVHRLDKGTSGVLVVAKDDAAHRDLARQFKNRTVRKTYLALVKGRPRHETGTIDTPIGRDRRHRARISSRTARPREALTRYRITERLRGASLVEVLPRTGRTHQIRVHFKLLGHPVIGDRIYGGASPIAGLDPVTRETVTGFDRLALHAYRLELDHPGTGSRVEYEAPLPDDLAALMETLRR